MTFGVEGEEAMKSHGYIRKLLFYLTRYDLLRSWNKNRILKRLDKAPLGLACARLAAAPGRDLEPLPLMTNWELVCVEVLDTVHSDLYCERVICELHRRNLNDEQIREMRMIAWETAVWLNFAMMMWEWASLSERDIQLAIEIQEREGKISHGQREQYEAALEKYRGDVQPYQWKKS